MKTILCIALLACAALAAPDTNVTGKWSGSFNITRDGETRDSTALLVLKQTGTEITGTVGPDESEQHAIKTGKIEGDKITILVEDEGRVINFALVVSGDRIHGDVDMKRDDGQTAKAKLDVTRAK